MRLIEKDTRSDDPQMYNDQAGLIHMGWILETSGCAISIPWLWAFPCEPHRVELHVAQLMLPLHGR